MREAIFNDPGQVVLGNPDGDVTLVEFFDYNCGYCRAALPDMATLLAEDPECIGPSPAKGDERSGLRSQSTQ